MYCPSVVFESDWCKDGMRTRLACFDVLVIWNRSISVFISFCI